MLLKNNVISVIFTYKNWKNFSESYEYYDIIFNYSDSGVADKLPYPEGFFNWAICIGLLE